MHFIYLHLIYNDDSVADKICKLVTDYQYRSQAPVYTKMPYKE